MKRLKGELTTAAWRRGRRDRRTALGQAEARLKSEIQELRGTLAQRRKALGALSEVRGYLDGSITPPPRRRSNKGPAIAGRKVNADRVLEVLKSLGGIQRADTIVQSLRRRYPGFGGANPRTQAYQILRTDARIERVGRGLYKLRPKR